MLTLLCQHRDEVGLMIEAKRGNVLRKNPNYNVIKANCMKRIVLARWKDFSYAKTVQFKT